MVRFHIDVLVLKKCIFSSFTQEIYEAYRIAPVPINFSIFNARKNMRLFFIFLFFRGKTTKAKEVVEYLREKSLLKIKLDSK